MRWIAKFAVLAMALFLFAGCGDDDDNGNGNGNGNGSGVEVTDSCMEAAATDRSCDDSDDCPPILCFCEDGETGGNSRICVMGSCGEPESHCSDMCPSLGHGEWTGDCESTETE